MRKSILLPLLLTACSDGSAAGYRIIHDFHDRAIPVACQAVDLGDVAVEELRLATDSSFLVLDAAQRRISEFSDGLRRLWTLEYEEVGPAAVDRPVSAVLLGDSAVAIAARGGLRLVVLDRGGGLLRARQLGFMPGAIAATDEGGVLVTAVPLGSTPGSLLFRLTDGGLEALPVPRRAYADMTVGALGNATRVEAIAPASALVVHQFLAPRAYHVSLGADAASVLPVPTPDATAGQIDFAPVPPITEDQLGDILAPAIAVSVDRGREEVFLMTRSGRWAGGRGERAILRLTRDLELLDAYTLDIHAVHMAVLPRRQAAIVADDLDRFFLCPLRVETRAE